MWERKHENLEDVSVVIRSRCTPGADCKQCRTLFQQSLRQGTVQTFGQNIANLVAAVALFIAAYFVNKGLAKAFLVWIGALSTLLYAYIIYAFDIHFNSLFLVYVAIVGLSFYTLVGSMIQIHSGEALEPYFVANTTARPVSVFLLLVAVLFSLLWLSEDIPALVTGAFCQV